MKNLHLGISDVSFFKTSSCTPGCLLSFFCPTLDTSFPQKKQLSISQLSICTKHLINPQHACTRVTVVSLSVCLCVCLSVSVCPSVSVHPSICLSVYLISKTALFETGSKLNVALVFKRPLSLRRRKKRVYFAHSISTTRDTSPLTLFLTLLRIYYLM